jgi:cupin 2 domain-containing protein
MDNLFLDVPDDFPTELFERPAESDSVRIERSVSRGHAAPPGVWYDQDTVWLAVHYTQASLAACR